MIYSLGFKILLTVFPTSFGRHWKEIKKTIETYMEKDESMGFHDF